MGFLGVCRLSVQGNCNAVREGRLQSSVREGLFGDMQALLAMSL